MKSNEQDSSLDLDISTGTKSVKRYSGFILLIIGLIIERIT